MIERSKLTRLAGRLLRFTAIGLTATLVHAVVLATSVSSASLRPSHATVLGFLAAVNVSYFGHYYFTYRSREPHVKAAMRFAVIAFVGAVSNWLLFVIINEAMGLNYWIAFAATIVIVPAILFVLLGRYSFRSGG